MDIIEHQHHRLDRRQPFEQLTHCAMSAVTLMDQPCPDVGGEPGQRRKDKTELGANVVVQLRQATRPRPRTNSSSASTNTQNGRSRSNSPAAPANTTNPAAQRRTANSLRSLVLPIPGSPTTASAAPRPSSSRSKA